MNKQNLKNKMPKEHDKIAWRLVHILQKLNNGERFTANELAEEFNVNIRTIQRDLNERLEMLPIEKESDFYKLESYALGQLSFDDIQNFATICGIKTLYPNLSKNFIVDILNNKINKVYLVKNQGYENIVTKSKQFEDLSAAILKNKQISFTYNQKHRAVNPYKLINQNNIWYLAAEEESKIKTYSFSKISDLKIKDLFFQPKKEILAEIEKSEINWFSNSVIEVVLEIDIKAKDYFMRKQILSNYELLKENEDCLIVQTKIAFEDEILNIVKYWIPYIKIQSPIYLQEKLNGVLQTYVKTTS